MHQVKKNRKGRKLQPCREVMVIQACQREGKTHSKAYQSLFKVIGEKFHEVGKKIHGGSCTLVSSDKR